MTKDRWWRRADPYRLALIGLWLVLAAVVVLNSLGSFNTDIKPEVYLAPWRTLRNSLAAWTSSPYLGSANFNVGLLPVLLVTVPLKAVGLSPEWVFKLSHLALWTFAAAGTMRFTRAIAPELGRWGALIAGAAYLANPYTVSAGATLAIALPLALLPWLLWVLWRGLTTPAGWRWPALFGLVFFAMSGMNAGVVPLLQLLGVIPVVVTVRVVDEVSIRHICAVLARCALFTVAVSLYWLVPSVAARSTGAQIVASSETIAGISKVSSFTEVLRGLGLWPLYGNGDQGAWVPQHAVYVAVPWIIAVTALWPIAALASSYWTRPAVRSFVVLSAAIAAVVMVGVFPGPQAPASPFGALLGRLFQNPVVAAFRTTNKIGAVLTLAFAIGVAATAVTVVPRLWRWPGAQPVLIVALALVFIGWTFPAVGGRLYISAMDVPGYWRQAASALDRESDAGSVLVLPGQVRPHYRWSVERPDDVLNSVLSRTAVVPDTTPNASAPGVNYLAALDQAVQSGVASPTVISSMARYLGASDVLLRHDMVWEDSGGARPAQTAATVAADTGLFGRRNFGRDGEYTMGDTSGYQYGEQNLAPLQWYQVRGAPTRLRTQSAGGSLLVAGDGFGFAALDDAGLLATTPLVRYAQNVSAKAWAAQLAGTSRMVLTDTNMRRDTIANRLTANEGPLLTARQKLGSSLTLGTNTDDQTVKIETGVRVHTTAAGGTFFNLPYAAGEFAVDGNLSTAWRFGDFDTADGKSITITFDHPVRLDAVPVTQLAIGGRRINTVRVSAGGTSRVITLPNSSAAVARLGGVRARTLTVTVESTRGKGYNLVGIAEIGIPQNVDRVLAARTPTTLSDRYRQLSAADRARFDRTPLDVLLTRVVNTSSTADDSETNLSRIFTLPDARTYRATARVRVNGSLDPVYDQLAGDGSSVRVESSGFYFDRPQVRASAAADGNGRTAWQPANGTLHSWWQITTAPRTIDHVSITQELGSTVRGVRTHRATAVSVTVDGRTVARSRIGLGTTRITLPRPVRGSVVRVTVTATSGDRTTVPPRFTTIDTGVTMPTRRGTTAAKVCLPVATLDGQQVMMRPTTSQLADFNSTGTVWRACATTTLSAGTHTVDQSSGFVLDSLHLTDQQHSRSPVTTAPLTDLRSDGSVHKSLVVGATKAPYAVVIGQSIDPRWTAYANGHSLGKPVLVDGYSAGWILPAGGARRIEIYYSPQRWTNVAIVATALTLLAIAVILVRSRRRARSEETGRTPIGTAPTSPPRRRWPPIVVALAFIAVATFFVGPAGLAAAVSMVAVQRFRPVPATWWIHAGLATLVVAFVGYLVVAGSALDQVSANAVAKSLVPHHLAAAGLVLTCAGALLRRSEEVP